MSSTLPHIHRPAQGKSEPDSVSSTAPRSAAAEPIGRRVPSPAVPAGSDSGHPDNGAGHGSGNGAGNGAQPVRRHEPMRAGACMDPTEPGLSARDYAVIDEVAAAVSANPAKAGDLIAIALSHHPNLAHRLVLESIKRCPTAASRVLSAARMSRSIGARLVFSTLIAVAMNKVFGLDIQANAAETNDSDAEGNPQHAQVAAFLAGLNAALALMPNKVALAQEASQLDVVEPDIVEEEGASYAGGASHDILDSGAAAVQPEVPLGDGDVLTEDSGTATSRSGVASVPASSDALSLEEALDGKGAIDANSLAQLAPVDGDERPLDDVGPVAVPVEETGSRGMDDGDDQQAAEESSGKIVDVRSADGYLVGGDGRDWLFGGDGSDVLVGGGGDDKLFGGTDRDLLLGQSGNDEIYGGHGHDNAWGGEGDDLVDGGLHHDRLYGGEGNDVLRGGHGDDSLFGDTGDDVAYGGEGSDKIWGGAGNDTLDGGDGDDAMNGGEGDDLLMAGAGSNRLKGAEGFDTVSYAQASGPVYASLADGVGRAPDGTEEIQEIEAIIGSAFDDSLVGDSGDNRLDGGDGNDRIEGGAGNDLLVGGDGSDTLTGGLGDDGYLFDAADQGFDIIVDSQGRNYVLLQGFEDGARVWAKQHESGDIDIMVRGADGQDTAVVRIQDYAAVPDSFAGVEIDGRVVDTESLIGRDELWAPPSADPDPADDLLSFRDPDVEPDGGTATDDILDPDLQAEPDDPGLVLSTDDGSDGTTVEVVQDELGQNIVVLRGEASDSRVVGEIDGAGDLHILVLDTEGGESLAATVEGYADSPDSLAAVSLNGRTLSVPDLLQGADLPPAAAAAENLPADVESAAPATTMAFEIENPETGEIETVLIDERPGRADPPPFENQEDDGQADGL